MITYSLFHPKKETLDRIGQRNPEAGTSLIENILKSNGISNATVYVENATEIRLGSEKHLPAPVIDALEKICEVKEL